MASKMADYIRGKKAYTKWDVDTDNVDMDIPPDSQQPRIQVISAGWFSGKKGKILKALFLIFLFLLGLILGYLIRHGVHEVIFKKEKSNCSASSSVFNFDEHYATILQRSVDVKQIENNLRFITKQVHQAGSKEDHDIAQYIKEKWKEYGLDSVHSEKFNVTLSLPSRDTPNKVELLDKDGQLIFSANSKDGDKYPVMLPYSAYSRNGTAQGKLVYAHYGTSDDFIHLTSINVPINGSIVIMRNGKTHRGGKVKLAEKFGAVGVLLYPDPADHGGKNMDIYPNGLGLPEDGVVRGSIKTYPGDPQTPFLPSYDGIYRTPEDELDLPNIIVQPISYEDAEILMRNLVGPSSPEDWKGDLNITYNLGPDFDVTVSNISEVRIMVQNELKQKEIHNILATIPGEFDPGRYIIIGGHHDSWTNGSSDPGTGVTVLMEVARGFGLLRKEGWKPGRTLVFASWDAEEFGMIGSTEWVEAHATELYHRGVAYINIDAAVTGNYTLQVLASPLLQQVIKEATREVTCSEKHHPDMSLYDMWRRRRPRKENSPNTEPLFEIPGSGSDFVSFMSGHGIPSAHLQFVSKDAVSDYPLFHTSYDTFDAVANYTDVGFRAMMTMTKLIGVLLMKLTDSVHLPIHVVDYSSQLKRDFAEFLEKNKLHLSKHDIKIDIIDDAIKVFETASIQFNNNYKTVGKGSLVSALHEYNDRMIAVERAFLLPSGVSVSSYFRHVIYGPDPHNHYKGVLFPHVLKAIYDALDEETPVKWNYVRIQLSYVLYALRSATGILKSNILSYIGDEL